MRYEIRKGYEGTEKQRKKKFFSYIRTKFVFRSQALKSFASGQAPKGRMGITLIETLLGIVIITIVGFGIYRAYVSLLDIFAATKVKIAMATLANERMEVVRNMPYSQIGTVGGIPQGVIPQVQSFTRDGMMFDLTTTVRNIDDPFDGTIEAPPPNHDSSPADYKLIELALFCTSCPGGGQATFTGRAAPKSLETASTNGALFVQAIDANGAFISGATVNVVNNAVIPAINITDVTNTNGVLQLVDVPPSAQSYQITVSKSGYSTERTYAPAQNFNPVKPHATVAVQTVTQLTFAIDRIGTVNAESVTNTCAPIPNTTLAMSGAKLVATNPNIAKYSQNLSIGASGLLAIPNLEWDTYTMDFSNPGTDSAGTIPNPPITLAPGGTQDVKAVFAGSNPSALLVGVNELATSLPLSDATVVISRPGFSASFITGRGFLKQTDWSGGSGQEATTDLTRYADDDGNIEALAFPGELRLKAIAPPDYPASGVLTSSTFDTGSASNFYNLTWLPASQPIDTGPDSVRFQIATASTSIPFAWTFLGPDGTAGSYFTTANGNINAVHNGDEYMRYRAYLTTASSTLTPTVSDVAVTFSSQCVPPGQVLFQGLMNDTYSISVTRNGYQPANDTATVNSQWQSKVINLSP